MNTILKLIITILLTTLGFATNATANTQYKEIELAVEGMTSDACPILLEAAVKTLEGVRNVDANLETHSASIEYDETIVSLEQIRQTIESNAGFHTTVKPH